MGFPAALTYAVLIVNNSPCLQSLGHLFAGCIPVHFQSQVQALAPSFWWHHLQHSELTLLPEWAVTSFIGAGGHPLTHD